MKLSGSILIKIEGLSEMLILKNQKRFFLYTILSYAILIFLTIQILTWILYFNFEKTGAQITNSLAEKNLIMTAYNLENAFDSAKSLCKQIYIDRDIRDLMNGRSFDQIKINTIFHRLVSYSNSSNYVHSIYIYSRKIDYFYCSFASLSNTSHDFFDKDIYDIVKNLKVKEFKPIPRIIERNYTNSSNMETTRVYTLILYNLGNERQVAESAVIVNIKAGWITDMLKSMEFKTNTNCFFLDSNGIIAGSSDEKDFRKSIYGEDYVKDILGSKKESGSLSSKIDNKNCLITYTSSNSLNWKFVRITPYELLFNQIHNMRNTTLLISFIILISAMFITFILSRNIFPRINKLFNKVESLETMKRDNYNSFRQDILKNLFAETPDMKIIDKNFKEFDVKLELQKDFILILLKIDHFAVFCEAHDSKGRNLMRFAIANLTNEIISKYYINEVLETGEDNLTVIINPNEISDFYLVQQIKLMLSEIQEVIHKHLSLSVSCIAGTRISGIKNISSEFNKILEMSNYRLIFGHSSIMITSEIIANVNTDEYKYPVHKEKLLFDSLMLGKMYKVRLIYNDMLNFTSHHSYNDLMAFFTHLALSLNSLLINLKNTVNLDINFDFYKFNKVINKLETLDEINIKFDNLFKDICDSLVLEKENKYPALISLIMEYISKNYHDPNLSLNIIAEYVDKSPVYLGRIFNKLTGKSISDCINETRLQKSMELLSESRANIEDICTSIGISNAKYFYIFFKKYTGITPSEYRNHKS